MRLADLSRQQRHILLLLAAGFSTKQIASRLDISERTVQWHVSRLLVRLGAATRAELIARAASARLIRVNHKPDVRLPRIDMPTPRRS